MSDGMTAASAPDRDFHTRVDPHRHASELSDVILGGQDGLVNVLGVILGVATATADARIVLAAGVAAALAESVSMAAVAYTTRRADQALYESEAQRERRHFECVPLLPFVLLGVHAASWLAVLVSGITLFAVGAYKSARTVGSWIVGGLEIAGIGLAAAAIGWVVGFAFRAR
jgi:VIT1/CCC1 family predicted Fe2+/Mn2+ transporter